MFKRSALLGTSAALALALAGNASAQDNNGFEEDEVIVTATKRAQTLQETPVAVSVTTSDIIEKAQILDLKDLQSVVPSLRVSQLQNSANTSFVIRGFGNGGNNIGIEPAVGIFIDGVYRSRAGAAINDLPRLDRVEVLSGPQSTLFGKNASAGVVSVVTAAPSFDTEGYVEGGIGNYGLVYGKAYYTTPISDNVAVSLGGGFQSRDGYFESQNSNAPDQNDRNRFNLRGQVLVEPNDSLSIRFIGDYSSLDEQCCGTITEQQGGTAGIVRALGGDLTDETDDFEFDVFLNRDNPNEIDDGGVSAEVNYDFGNHTLTSISAYRTNSAAYESDSDFTSADILGNVFQDVDINTFTQELRLTSNFGGQFEYMVGGYFFDEDIDLTSGIDYGAATRPYVNQLVLALSGGTLSLDAIEGANLFIDGANATTPPGGFFNASQGTREEFTQENTAFSIFGNVDYKATDRLTATVGLSYISDEKDVTLDSVQTDTFSQIDLSGAEGTNVVAFGLFSDGNAAAGIPDFSTALGGLPFTPANLAAARSGAFGPAAQGYVDAVFGGAAGVAGSPTNPLLGLTALQFQPQSLDFPNSVEDGNTQDDQLTWSVRLAYEMYDNVNVYASAATGYKASSWNLTRDTRPFASDAGAITTAGIAQTNQGFGTRFASPEEATVFELGVKARFERGAINLAIFDQTIEGFQSTIFQGTGFVLANAGEQSTTGLEFDSTFDATDNLKLTLAGTFLDPIYDSFVGAQGPNGPTDLSGLQPAGIPEIALFTSATYTRDFSNGSVGFIRGEYQFENEIQIVDNAPTDVTREVNEFNASAGLELESGLSFQVWARNLFDDQYGTSAFPPPVQAGSVNIYPNPPRTYGVNVRKTF